MNEHNMECNTDMTIEQKQAIECLKKAMQDSDADVSGEILWDTIIEFQGFPFYTAKSLEFFYIVKGNEMFVTRKDKSITRASVMAAFYKAWELGGVVTGPKKLGTFGASYLYPVFQKIGVIKSYS